MARKKIDLGPKLFGFPDEELHTSLHDEIVLWLKKKKHEIAAKLVKWDAAWAPDFVEKLKAKANAAVDTRKRELETVINNGVEQLRKLNAERVGISEQLALQRKTVVPVETNSTTDEVPPEQAQLLWRIKLNEDQLKQSEDACMRLSKKLDLQKEEMASLLSWSGLGDPPPPEIEVETQSEYAIQRMRYQTKHIEGYLDVVLFVRATKLAISCWPYDLDGPLAQMVKRGPYVSWHVEWKKLGDFAFDAKASIPSFGTLIRQFRTYEVFSKFPFYAVSPDARFASEISDEGFGFVTYPEGAIIFPKPKVER